MAFWNKSIFGKKKPIVNNHINLQSKNRTIPKDEPPEVKQVNTISSENKKHKEPKEPKKVNTIKSQKSFQSRDDFLNVFNKFGARHRPWDIWADFITMTACSISNSVDERYYDKREKLYLKTIKKYNKKEQLLFPELLALTVLALDKNGEQDFLGSIFMELGLGNSKNGQFFTPYSVCELMAAVAVCDVNSIVEENGYISINDPTCGAGATLIAGIHEARKQLEKENLNFQNHVLVSGQDIDYITGLMCYIQISLLGVAGYIKIGNSLTEPMSSNDKLDDDYWFTPMYYSQTWVLRRFFNKLGGNKNE